MNGLTALEARFMEGNVPLGVLLGVIGALSTLQELLPHNVDCASPAPEVGGQPEPIEPFIALLLGTITVHDRLTTLIEHAPTPDRDPPISLAPRLIGLLR